MKDELKNSVYFQGLKKNVEGVVRRFGKFDLWLIGSRARGDYSEDSDWDFIAIVKDGCSGTLRFKYYGDKISVKIYDTDNVPIICDVIILSEGIKIRNEIGYQPKKLSEKEIHKAFINESRKIVDKMCEYLKRHADEFPFNNDEFGAVHSGLKDLMSLRKTMKKIKEVK